MAKKRSTAPTKKVSAKPSKKSSKQKVFKQLFSALVIAFAIIGLCFIAFSSEMNRGLSEVTTAGNFEDDLFTEAYYNTLNANMNIQNATLDYVQFDSSFSDLGLYTITLKEFPETNFKLESCPIWGDDNDLEEINQQTKFKDFSARQKKIIESSRQHVIEYINDSEVFTNKEMLIEGIKNVSFYMYTESTHEQLANLEVAALHLGDGIYCNYSKRDFFCEYVVVHELVHHIRYLTSGGKLSNELYFATPFDETITDVITLTMDPATDFKPGYGSPYMVFYEPTYKYLNLFGREALRAYFYGYDEFFEKNGGNTFKYEHNAFVVSLAYYDIAQDGIICTEGIYNAWNARF